MNVASPPAVRRTAKSDAAFRTISEVSEELDVPQHVLRFWESKFAQVKPLKRGGGRRYYRPGDVQLLRRIRDLLYRDGYTIKGVQKLLVGGGVAALEAASAQSEPAAPMPAAAKSAGGDDGKRAALSAVLDELLEIRAMLRQRAK